MHFWINKGNQGCGFNGRYVPPSISAGTRRNHSGWVHPKPMVTPVHRFQSIESVISGVPRHPRASSYHTRFSTPFNQHQQASNHSGAGSNSIEHTSSSSSGHHHSHQNASSVDYSSALSNSLTPHDAAINAPTAKLKCGIWMIISLVPFFIVALKYYFNRDDVGWEAFLFCIILILVMFIGAFVSLFEACNLKRQRRESVPVPLEHQHVDTTSFDDAASHVPNLTPVHNSELQPPPYHIAVMLPTQNERLTIIQDSPPPTYEKAVT